MTEPPSTLPQEAQARWRAVYPALARRGVVDREQLAAYCGWWVRWRKAEDQLGTMGSLVKGRGETVRANPLLSVARQAAQEVRALEQHLGIGDAEPEPAPIVGGTAWRMVNRVQLAELLGVHIDTVTEYARLGMPVVNRGGRGKESVYDSVICASWWRDQNGANAKEAAQARALSASAELNELKLQRELSEVYPRADIILAGQATKKGWATAVRSLPRRMTQAGLIQRTQEPTVIGLCAALLREIVAWDPLEAIGVKKRKGAA